MFPGETIVTIVPFPFLLLMTNLALMSIPCAVLRPENCVATRHCKIESSMEKVNEYHSIKNNSIVAKSAELTATKQSILPSQFLLKHAGCGSFAGVEWNKNIILRNW